MKIDIGTVFGHWRYSAYDHSVEQVQKLLAKHGIDKAFASSTTGIFYDDISANDKTLSVCRQDDNLYPVGTISFSKYLDVEEEVAKRKEQGFKAFRIYNEYEQINFKGLVFKNFLTLLEKERETLIVKANGADGRSCIDDIAQAVADVNVPVLVLDLSGYDMVNGMHAAMYAKNIYYGTRLFNTMSSLELFCEKIGPDRLLFNSGIPFYYGNQAICRIQTALIDEASKEKIFSGNVLRIFGGTL